MDQQQDDEAVLGEAPFDERKALEELQRMRQEIRRYQTVREGVNDEFERFVQSFKKPEAPREVAAEPRRVMPEPRVAEPPRTSVPPPPTPEPALFDEPSRIGEPSPVPEPPRAPEPPRIPEISRVVDATKSAAPPVRVTIPETPLAPPPPPVIPEPSIPPDAIKPASARFEPLNLEPFIKRLEDSETAPATAHISPTPPHRVPTSPEEFLADRDEEDDRDAFAPGADFDALPPPLDPVPEPLLPLPPPPAAGRASSGRTSVVLGSILAVVAVGGYAWKLTHSSDPSSVEQPAPGATPPAQSTPGRTAANPAPAENAPAAATLQSEVVTTQRAWVRVIADGQRVVERELPANSRIPFDAQKTIQVRTGNAGAVRITIRGVDKGALGRLGEVVTRSFNVTAR